MDKQEMNIDPLFHNIAQLIEKGQQTIIRSVNYSQLYVNYHIGKYIVDDEQDGIRRAQYGKRLIKTLSERLTSQYGMGFSAKNLELMRNFFLLYSKTQTLSAILEPEQNKTVTESGSIPQTVSAKLGSGNRPVWLSWSHYVFLMQVDNLNERSFYEIEALQQNWSLREMKRVNYYDRNIIAENENQTIGIVLCKQKDQTLVEMTLPVDNNQIFAAKYQTVLPNKEQLKQILEEGYNG